MQSRPIGIDLFAGAGGMSLGFEQAGFDIAAAVEIDPVHCAVHKFNFPNTPVIAKSVEHLSGQQIRDLAGIGDKEISCVFGGPPCQGFSLIGQRVIDDPRNSLVRDFVRLVSELDAETFVFENVKGLTLGKHAKFLNELVHEFQSIGYEIQTPWKVLNAADYGVPQNRERLILMGAKKGRNTPCYPEPFTVPADKGTRGTMQPKGPTVEDALGDIPNAEIFKTLLSKDSVSTKKFSEPSAYAAELRCLTENCWHFGYSRNWDTSLLTSSARTEHTEISRRRFAETLVGNVEPISRFFKLAPDGLSNTLRAGTDSARGAFTSPRPIHYKFARVVTVREMARLHGFPDWFRLHVTKWHGARQIGNAVPPPMGRAVANKVLESLSLEPVRPQTKLDLGNPNLLEMEMGVAASYFGVKAPTSRRDKKSGVKKRKQADIEKERLRMEANYG